MRFILIILLSGTYMSGYAQLKLPDSFLNFFHKKHLDAQYELKAFVKPSFLVADFDGDKRDDICTFLVDKKSHKRGVIVLLNSKKTYYIFGAGSKVGKKGLDETDEFNWVQLWSLQKSKTVYETKFKDGDMVGTIKRNIKNIGISIWSLEDGEKVAGGVIYWNGKKWAWIHQGE